MIYSLVFGGGTMTAAAANSTCLKASSKPISGKNQLTSRVIINGLIKLIEGQKRFANEFGLPFERVFRHTAKTMCHEDTSRVFRSWLQDSEDGATSIAHLLTDIIEHNIALYAALDGIATESLAQLSPKATHAHSFKICGWRPFLWRTFRKRHQRFSVNEYLRHQQIVVAGFSKAYDQQRLGEQQY